MGFINDTKQRLVEWLGAVPAAELATAVNRAYESGFYDGNDDPATATFKSGGQGYKRISDNYLREGSIDFKAAIKTAWELWQKSPIAKRVLAMKRDHIIGHSAMPSADNNKINNIVKAFWMDNKLDKRASQFTIQLFGFGEQCFPVFVRAADGRVRLGYIDPGNIHEIIKHRDNSLEDWAVCIEQMGNNGVQEKRVYRIIRQDEPYADESEAVESKHEGKLVTWEQAALEPWEAEMLKKYGRERYDGSCFFYKVNAISNQSRGMSDLLQVADWVDQADEVLFALADREQMAGYFAFDVTLTSGDDTKVKSRASEIRLNPPKKGSVNIHNDSEAWEQWAPNLGQTGTIETFRAILGLILGGLGFPVHWYGFGDDANRATAVAQSNPSEKSLEHDQGIVKNMFLNMCQFAIDQAEIVGTLGDAGEEYELTLNLPKVSVKDTAGISASLSQLVQVLSVATDRGWLQEITAVTILSNVLSELDMDIDPADELKKATAEREERELDEEQRRSNALRGMIDNRAAAFNLQANGQTAGVVDMLRMNGEESDGGR